MKMFSFLAVAIVVIGGGTYAFHELAKEKLPPHFSGLGLWIYKDLAVTQDPVGMAAQAKTAGLSFVIIKANDGSVVGTRIGKTWTSQFNSGVPHIFHEYGIRCYAYGTLRIKDRVSANQQADLILWLLHDLGADGFIADDAFVYGQSEAITRAILEPVRRHLDTCSNCEDKILAFSTFPHILRNWGYPWKVAAELSDYYLPQEYWNVLNLTPHATLQYTQGNWDAFRAYYPTECQIVPVGMGKPKEETLISSELEEFLELTNPWYRGVVLFHWSTLSPGDWLTIQTWAEKFKPTRRINNPSLEGAFALE